jgi:hypothetical protein
MNLVRFSRVPLAALLLLSACSKSSPASDNAAADKAAAAGPLYHCYKKTIQRCEQTSEAQLKVAKAKLEAGTPDEKKMAGFLSLTGFQAMCDKGEYGEGACKTENAVGACVSPESKSIYYGGADGYKADEFAYECSKNATPESADGKPMPKPKPQRMSCFHSKDKTCDERDFEGKISKIGFCEANDFSGPAEFALKACEDKGRVGSCASAPISYGGETRASTSIRYAYDAKGAAQMKSVCEMMKDTYKKL